MQRADRAAIDDLLARGVVWERPATDSNPRVFEEDGRIIAVSWARVAEIAPPLWQPEPVPEIGLIEPGDQTALVGGGLVLATGLTVRTSRTVHRLARTLAAQERGLRWTVVEVPLPNIEGFDPPGVAQQICAGAIVHPQITVPLSEGYWPVGTRAGDLVLVCKNDAF
jgi:hypothetical protein